MSVSNLFISHIYNEVPPKRTFILTSTISYNLQTRSVPRLSTLTLYWLAWSHKTVEQRLSNDSAAKLHDLDEEDDLN